MSDPTIVEELAELRGHGYAGDFAVAPDGQLRCGACGDTHPAGDAVVESTARFEGPSNPDDEAVVFGLRCRSCGVLGVLVAAYGPTATADEAAVVTALVPPSA